MKTEWLIRQIRIDELPALEAEYLLPVMSDDFVTVSGDKLPFGEHYFMWRKMKKVALTDIHNSAIWEFNSGRKSFGHMAGRAGYCLVRRGVVSGYAVVTKMN